ncbi:unnamed protein product, partial [Hapterophycus canaliculatus]
AWGLGGGVYLAVRGPLRLPAFGVLRSIGVDGTSETKDEVLRPRGGAVINDRSPYFRSRGKCLLGACLPHPPLSRPRGKRRSHFPRSSEFTQYACLACRRGWHNRTA